MSLEIKALQSILAVKGLKLPTDVEASNPVSEFISEQFTERFPDNEMLVILRDLFVDRANNDPLATLQALQLFNHAIMEFSLKETTKSYVQTLTEKEVP